MASIEELKANLGRVDRGKYPELRAYSREEIWREIGPGGLYLVTLAARKLELEPGSLVLDLGSGHCVSSIYLAEQSSARVIAADLWTDPSQNARRIESRGQTGNVIPMRLDASEPLPFAEEYFDAILILNSLNFYGTDLAVIDSIARHLKKEGVFLAGGECLSGEFTPAQMADPPKVYAFAQAVWEDDFATSHSPGWWAEHIDQSELLQVQSCIELEDGQRYYEEAALVTEPQGYFGMSPAEARALEIRQIEWGRENEPTMTVYQLVARRI